MLVAMAGLALVVPANPAAAAATLAEQLRSLHARGLDWRSELEPSRASLRGTRAPSGGLDGVVVADTVTLPDSILLTGDTTIVARQVALTGRSLAVRTNGYALRVYPVQAVRAGTPVNESPGGDGVGRTGSMAVLADTPIRIGGTGTTGTDGSPGSPGSPGVQGTNGTNGADGDASYWQCDGYSGLPGGPGGDGVAGGAGVGGGAGGAGGQITFDIPDGDPHAYELGRPGPADQAGGLAGGSALTSCGTLSITTPSTGNRRPR